ncbi:MAG: hypothetical protein ACJ74W_21860 [Pyrinomonadaceae bacterium]
MIWLHAKNAKRMMRILLILGALSFFAVVSLSCEIDTKLSIKGGSPPIFIMSGNGRLTSIRVRGHERQRDAQGEDQYLYRVIQPKKGGSRSVDDIGSVAYGEVPDGYEQKYPESGKAPPIVEGQHYYVHIVTANANGADGYFMMLNGKAIFDPIEPNLPEEMKASK